MSKDQMNDMSNSTAISAQLVFQERIFRKEDNIELPNIDNSVISNLNKIELLQNEGKLDTALGLWNEKFITEQEFIPDIVLMGLLIENQQYHQALEIQIFWQRIFDKFDLTPYLLLYLAKYQINLGHLYKGLDEFEIAANQLKKGEKYCQKLDFKFGEYYIEHNIVQTLIELGAWGEARYHLRQIQRLNYEMNPAEKVDNYLLLGTMYMKSDQYPQCKASISNLFEKVPRFEEYLSDTHMKLIDLLFDYLRTEEFIQPYRHLIV